MIPLLLLLQATTPTLRPLDRQALPASGCAAYLWSVADRSFVAVAGAEAATLRIRADGKVVDLPRVAQEGQAGLGLASSASYEGDGLSATLTMTVVTRDDLANGGAVTDATLTLRRSGADELVQPLAGLVGCRPQP